jgi:3-hydroxyisobutyrate dehydrogenase-like beta-hydroxyacid dehydrogenase
MQVSFIGLGRMGSGMAGCLIAAGHDVTVYNRTRTKAEPLAAKGATIADSVADACKTGTVMTMLADDAAAEHMVLGADGIVASLPAGGIHVSSSTISPAMSKRLAAAHTEAGQHYLAAPVFGRPEAAAGGKLFVVVGGSQETAAKVAPLLQAIGQKVDRISDAPEAANLVKLSGNFLIASVIESLGEAMALVEKAGVDRHHYLQLMTSSLFDIPVYKTYGGFIADNTFEPPGFTAPLGLKDMRLALAAGEELRVPLPLANLLHDRFLTLIANGGEALDWSAIGSLAAKDAGISRS